jgi:hypothetical protein
MTMPSSSTANRRRAVVNAGPDPIFAVIDGHKAAYEKWEAAVNREFSLKFSDPRMKSAQEASEKLAKLKNDLLKALVSTSPTTIDGIVALAEYYRDVTLLSQGSEEPDSLKDAEDGIAKSYLFYAADNIARSLKAISAPV